MSCQGSKGEAGSFVGLLFDAVQESALNAFDTGLDLAQKGVLYVAQEIVYALGEGDTEEVSTIHDKVRTGRNLSSIKREKKDGSKKTKRHEIKEIGISVATENVPETGDTSNLNVLEVEDTANLYVPKVEDMPKPNDDIFFQLSADPTEKPVTENRDEVNEPSFRVKDLIGKFGGNGKPIMPHVTFCRSLDERSNPTKDHRSTPQPPTTKDHEVNLRPSIETGGTVNRLEPPTNEHVSGSLPSKQDPPSSVSRARDPKSYVVLLKDIMNRQEVFRPRSVKESSSQDYDRFSYFQAEQNGQGHLVPFKDLHRANRRALFDEDLTQTNSKTSTADADAFVESFLASSHPLPSSGLNLSLDSRGHIHEQKIEEVQQDEEDQERASEIVDIREEINHVHRILARLQKQRDTSKQHNVGPTQSTDPPAAKVASGEGKDLVSLICRLQRLSRRYDELKAITSWTNETRERETQQRITSPRDPPPQ